MHWINIRPGLNIEQLLNHIKIPRESVGLITVNGLKGSLTDKLKENDVISIFPHVSGG
ncbi:MAG: MoaD/ThiS family protein [Bacillota bacterium]